MAGFMDSWGFGQPSNPWGTPPYFPVGDGSGMGGGLGGMTGMGGFGSMSGWSVPPVMSTTAPTTTTVPSTVAAAGRMSPKLGFNMDTANLALTGLSTIGNLWAAFQAQKLAKEQFKYTKGVTDTNLANQIQTYNTGLTDRANNRAIVEGRTPEQTKAYIDANSLRRYGS